MALLTGLFAARNSAGNGTSPRGARRALGGLLARGGAGPIVRTGVLFDDGSPVVAGTSSWALNIRPFTAVAKYTDANGPVVFANDAAVSNVSIAAAPGSGNRIDIVYALHPLVSSDGGTGDSVTPGIGVASSSVGASPTPPSLPAGAVELSRGTVSAGMTSSADVAWSTPQWTVMNGGLLPNSNGQLTAWNGSTWKRVVEEEDTGWVQLSPAANYSFDAPGCFVRKKNGLVQYRGSVRRASGTVPAGGLHAFSLPVPAEFIPSYPVYYNPPTLPWDSDVAALFVELNMTNRQLFVGRNGPRSTHIFRLDQFSYFID